MKQRTLPLFMRVVLYIMLTPFHFLSAALPYPTIIEGDEFVPRGFVVNTEDKEGDILYTPDDYVRMVKMGANWQVVRLAVGRLGGYPGNALEPAYLERLSQLVRMGKNHGIRTVFKMTVYQANGFDWGDFWRNENQQQDFLRKAWTQVWTQFKDEPYVYGYDLLNEPLKGDFEADYDALETKHLVPLLRTLIDESRKINPSKVYFYQALLYEGEIRKNSEIPFKAFTTPINRKDVVFAAHTYEYNKDKVQPTLERYRQDAALSKAALFMGEWGPATFDETDSSITAQQEFVQLYIETASQFDRLGLGSIKAWFTGTRFKGQNNPRGPFTWAIFSDPTGAGIVERKYIVDVICRPCPQQVHGRIERFEYDYASRVFTLRLQPNHSSRGVTKIYIPQDRHYPDGFTLRINDAVTVCYNPYKNAGLEVANTDGDMEASGIVWDRIRNQLIISDWPKQQSIELMVMPGIVPHPDMLHNLPGVNTQALKSL